jgi:flagellar basal body-associated protein FliL
MADSGNDAAPKKKKGKKALKAGLWIHQVERLFTGASTQIKEIGRGLQSPDRATRRMSLLFFVSLTGAVALVGFAVHQVGWKSLLTRKSGPDAAGKNIGEFIGKQADEARRVMSTALLGQFTLELKPVPGQERVHGVMNMAEVELVVECDNPESCGYVLSNLTQVRNQVTNVFVEIEREDLLSKEGKRKIKRALMEKLNRWLPKGRIENLYFSKVVVS